MSREKEDFRIHLERLSEAFPEMEIITLNQVCKHLHKDPKTLKRNKAFPLNRNGKTGFYEIRIVALARWLAS